MNRKTSLLFIILLVIKSGEAIYLSHLTSCQSPENRLGSFSYSSGDTFSYTGAMENYFNEGTYYFFNGKENIYAGRLPHYSIPYLFFRQIASTSLAHDLDSVFQLILQCMVMTLLVVFVYRQTKNRIAAIVLLLLLIFESNWTLLSIYASPESISCSLLGLLVITYFKYLENRNNKTLIVAGIWLGLLVTMKAYYLLVFIPIGIHFLFEHRDSIKSKLKNALYKSLLISIPLFALLSPWIVRNYQVYNRFIPLQIGTTAGYNYTDAELSFRKFVTAWGGDFIFWEKKSAGCYFIPTQGIPCEFKMPEYAFCSKYGPQEIEEVRNLFITLQKKYSDSLDRVVAAKFNELTNYFKSEKPFRYYVLSKIDLTCQFLIHSGSFYLPIHRSSSCFSTYQLLIKIAQSAIYWTSFLLGISGLLLWSYKLKNSVLIFIPLFLIVLFPIILTAAEARYFRTCEPILYLGVAYLIASVLDYMKEKKFQKGTTLL